MKDISIILIRNNFASRQYWIWVSCFGLMIASIVWIRMSRSKWAQLRHSGFESSSRCVKILLLCFDLIVFATRMEAFDILELAVLRLSFCSTFLWVLIMFLLCFFVVDYLFLKWKNSIIFKKNQPNIFSISNILVFSLLSFSFWVPRECWFFI